MASRDTLRDHQVHAIRGFVTDGVASVVVCCSGRVEEVAALDALPLQMRVTATAARSSLPVHPELGSRRCCGTPPMPPSGCMSRTSREPSPSSTSSSQVSIGCCARFSGCATRVPEPQRAALGAAFGLETSAPPDRFLVGLATLTLLADAANERPLLCIIDDAEWIDPESIDVITFVARRLHAERIALLCGIRVPTVHRDPLDGFERLTMQGLTDADAEALLVRRPVHRRARRSRRASWRRHSGTRSGSRRSAASCRPSRPQARRRSRIRFRSGPASRPRSSNSPAACRPTRKRCW